jgi:hypothetical protein
MNGSSAGSIPAHGTNFFINPIYSLKTFTIMTQQAINSINLYKGNDPMKIQMLLRIQSTSVVNELMEHFGASSISDLAMKLAFA